MAEGNGSGRIERIEALLEKMAERIEKMAERTTTNAWLHEQRLLKIEENLEQMQDEEKAYRIAQRERDAAADARVDRIVTSIGELISRIPPAALKS
jgi:hypothetical protein